MSLRSLVLVVVAFVAMACGADKPSRSTGPTTAREKQLLEAKASGDPDAGSKHWGGWRYRGDRDACFFILGSKCFKTESAACSAAKCKKPKKCDAAGAAPATITCR